MHPVRTRTAPLALLLVGAWFGAALTAIVNAGSCALA